MVLYKYFILPEKMNLEKYKRAVGQTKYELSGQSATSCLTSIIRNVFQWRMETTKRVIEFSHKNLNLRYGIQEVAVYSTSPMRMLIVLIDFALILKL